MAEHCAAGGLAAVYENGYLLLRVGNHYIPIEEAVNIPITFGGKANFNIANALAAVLAAYTSRIKLGVIREALRTFEPSYENTPGRMNLVTFNDFTVVLDYAHNPHGLKALGQFVRTMDVDSRIGIITGVGDRRDEDIIALGEEAARIFDQIIIRHDEDMRGRTAAEINALLTTGIRNVNAAIPISDGGNECEAVEKALQVRRPRTALVVLTENIQAVTECVQKYKREEEEQMVTMRTAV
ncbi:MAG: hypothetical protein EOO14_25215 [Chitinophagaceae bacterium]|nr:MAG: hypothetical protein EOO14_25215 [Chitinophagaceae bacterium]